MKFSDLSIGAAAVFGASSIALGALGAHALKNILSPESLESFETGVRYQIYHSLLLLILPSLATFIRKSRLKLVAILTSAGIVLFSGSIYLLTCSSLLGIDAKFAGPITPIGGVLLISAWLILLYGAAKKEG